MRKFLAALVILGLIGLGVFYVLTMPRTLAAASLPAHTPDLKNGETIFYAGGCASCHAAPIAGKCDNPKYAEAKLLAGGRCLKTPFGTFNVPNISPDPESGIGGWSSIDFVNAMQRGVAPDGSHYYPAFPFTSYQRMKVEDVLDLKAYLDTLPAVKSDVAGHDLALPFRLRRGLGLWKLLYLDGQPFTENATASAEINRGAYLVEGPGHCGECHTPRNPIGGPDQSRKLGGGPAPEGKDIIPNLTPGKGGLSDWTEGDVASALETGLLPDGDFVGGSMVAVQENMAKLAANDRKAIAAYLKSLAPVDSPPPKK